MLGDKRRGTTRSHIEHGRETYSSEDSWWVAACKNSPLPRIEKVLIGSYRSENSSNLQ
jgi:hypothetical protein